MILTVHEIHVIIENKQGMSDPEGETILNDLILKGGHKEVSQVKTARMLKFTIDATTSDDALHKVKAICDELRIYNPVASKIVLKTV